MKKNLYALIILIGFQKAGAQIPEEALRLSWLSNSGSARSMATGGAMVSLGGDATANLINPAGLGFYKTSDFVISPVIQFGKGINNFRGTTFNDENKFQFQLGSSGIILGGFGYKAKNSFAVTVTQRADFNRPVTKYNGLNNYSSFAESLADEFAGSQLTIDEALNSTGISLTTKMALYTYLVDTATINGSKQVIARSEIPGTLYQEHISQTSGGTTEITFGMAHEINKKIFVGASLGIPITSLHRNSYYRESDATGNNNNNFNFLAYRENYKLTGWGLNLRAGIIYRPKEYIRLGLAIHSPDMMMLKESLNAGMAADLEKLFDPNPGYDSVASTTFGEIPDLRYTLYTPGKIMISGSYVFREVENIKRQVGFITADIEYINYKWNRFGSNEEETPDTKDYYEPFNKAIDAIYKGAFNFRVGGELKFRIVMARLGFAYYSSPYKDKALKAQKMNLSGGLGYRNKGIFIDLTYVHRVNKDVHFPYRVNAPRANTFATLKDKGATVLLTFGCKI